MSMRPGPSLMTASPMSGWWSSTTSATSPRRNGLPSRSSTRTWARSSGVDDRQDVPDPEPLVGVSMNPPVPIIAPSEYCSSPASRASAVTVHDLVERHVVAPSTAPDRPAPAASACARPRSPRSPRRGRAAAGPDLPVGDHRQIHQRQLVRRQPDLHDPAGRRQGLEHDRRGGPGRQRRRTPLRAAPAPAAAREEVGPALEDEHDRRQRGTDLERITSSPGTPLSACSSGMVISSSTSVGGQPEARRSGSPRAAARTRGRRPPACGAAARRRRTSSPRPRDHEESELQARATIQRIMTEPSLAQRARGGHARPRTRFRTARPLRPSPPWCRPAGPSNRRPVAVDALDLICRGRRPGAAGSCTPRCRRTRRRAPRRRG